MEDTLLLLGVKGRRPNFIRQGPKIHVAGELQRVGQARELTMQDQASLSAGLTRLPEKWILKERAFPRLANASRMHFQFLASVEIQKRNDGNKTAI